MFIGVYRVRVNGLAALVRLAPPPLRHSGPPLPRPRRSGNSSLPTCSQLIASWQKPVGWTAGTFRSVAIYLASTDTSFRSMACHISFRSVTFVPGATTVTITAITDVACHLWCRLSLEPPRIHKKSVTRRGEPFMSELRFCFTVYEDNEQEEAGDTLTHTFIKPAWSYCTTKYFYLWGKVSGVTCVSTSPPFHYHNTYEAPAFLEYYEHIAAHADDCCAWVTNGHWAWSTTMAYGRVGWFTFSTKRGCCGFRFRDFPLSSTSTVLEAKLNYLADEPGPGLELKSIMTAEESLDAQPFTTHAEWWSRPVLPLELRCDDIPAWLPPNWYWSPDISALINLIIGQPGWAPGKAIVINWHDHADESGPPFQDNRRMEQFSPLTPADCTHLYVKYIP